MTRYIYAVLLLACIIGCASKPASKPDPTLDLPEYKELLTKTRPRHLQIRAWCYTNGICNGEVWPDDEDFARHHSAEWLAGGKSFAEVFRNLSVKLDGPSQNTPELRLNYEFEGK